MKVIVNNIELIIFRGATVGDAIRAYYSRQGKKAPSSLPEVEDTYGNYVAHDGALTDGSQLIIKNMEEHYEKKSIFSISFANCVSKLRNKQKNNGKSGKR